MADQNPETRRVSFELSAQDVPDLLVVLGDFVTSHNITISFDETPNATEPSLFVKPAQEQYDPNLVVWIFDSVTGQRVPTITKHHLREFAQKENNDTTLGERLGNALNWDSNSIQAISPYLTMSADGEKVLGIRADRANALAELLRSGAVGLNNVGTKAIQLLCDYCDALLPAPKPEPTPKLNPDMVVWVQNGENSDEIAVVTEDLAQQFERARGYSSGFGSRSLLAVLRGQDKFTLSYGATVGYVNDKPRGLIAFKLPELVEKLAYGEISLYNVGPHAIKFLGEYATALFQTERVQ